MNERIGRTPLGTGGRQMTEYLDCPECGSHVFPSEDGFWWEDDETCQDCGVVCSVSVDDGLAHIRSTDHAEDIGQPRCDNTCKEVHVQDPRIAAEFIGAPCRWNCQKAAQFIAEAGRIKDREGR